MEKLTNKASRCFLTQRRPMAGHNVSHANNRTKRTFAVNLQRARLFSTVLDRSLNLKISTRGLRTVDKHGGLDDYLLSTSNSRLTIPSLLLKRKLLKTKRGKELHSTLYAERPARRTGLRSQANVRRNKRLGLPTEIFAPKNNYRKVLQHGDSQNSLQQNVTQNPSLNSNI